MMRKTAEFAWIMAVGVVLGGMGSAWGQCEIQQIGASDGKVNDRFGQDVSMDGEYAVIGASAEDTVALDAGAAYIFKRNGSMLAEFQKLTAGDGTAFAGYGASVGISGDAAVVGAPKQNGAGRRSGAAYIYRLTGSNWGLEQELSPAGLEADDQFGSDVSVSGNTLLVGALGDDDGGSNAGAVYVYRFDGSTWNLSAKLVADDGAVGDYFGAAVALGPDLAVVGARLSDAAGRNSGAAYIFRNNGSAWVQVKKLVGMDTKTGDWFGEAVAIDASGERVVVGALKHDDAFKDTGAAYVFKGNSGAWDQEAKLAAGDLVRGDHFGSAVAVLGFRIVVGADDQNESRGSIYSYEFSGSSWDLTAKLVADGQKRADTLGISVDVESDSVLAGRAQTREASSEGQGAASFYDLTCEACTGEEKITSIKCEAKDGNKLSVTLKRGKPGAIVRFRPDGNSALDIVTVVAADGQVSVDFFDLPAGPHTIEVVPCGVSETTSCP